VILQESCMALRTVSRLSVEIALHAGEAFDFC